MLKIVKNGFEFLAMFIRQYYPSFTIKLVISKKIQIAKNTMIYVNTSEPKNHITVDVT